MLHVPQRDRSDRESPGSLRLLVASDVRFVRESLSEVLGRHDGLSVLGQCADAGQTLRLGRDLRPDMVLLDAGAHDGQATVRRLREMRASLRVVVFALTETVDAVLRWAKAGVDGYIPSTAGTSDLGGLILEIGAGRQACSALVAAALLQRVAETPTAPPTPERGAPALTPREMEIVRLIGTGLSNKEIARRLDIGLATTKSHVHNAFAKLNVQRRSQVASWMHEAPARG